MKISLSFFTSYAHADQDLADNLVSRLAELCAPSKRYAYNLWRDTQLLAGECWDEEIQQALRKAQIGLVFLSPAALASDYMQRQELPTFLGDDAKPIIPVMLKRCDLQRHDLQGLEHYQIFRLDHAKSFAECTTAGLKDRFAQALFDQIERRLDRLFGPSNRLAHEG